MTTDRDPTDVHKRMDFAGTPRLLGCEVGKVPLRPGPQAEQEQVAQGGERYDRHDLYRGEPEFELAERPARPRRGWSRSGAASTRAPGATAECSGRRRSGSGRRPAPPP